MTSSSHGASAKTRPCSSASAATTSGVGPPEAIASPIPQKKCSKPAGLITSIIRAGTDPAFHICRGSPPRLGDVAAGSQDNLAVAGPKSDHTFGDDRVLVLSSVQVRGDTGTDREWVLNDRNIAVGLIAKQLEHHPDCSQVSRLSFARAHHSQFRHVDTFHGEPLLDIFEVQLCIAK